MALSEQEQRMLAEIEKALVADDPRLARQASRTTDEATFTVNIQSIALIMLGLVGLVGGIALAQNSLWFVGVSVVGFLIMFGGGLLSFRPKGGGSPSRASSGAKKKQSVSAHDGNGLGNKMEDSFRRRFER